VLGAYERGERTISVPRLQRLATLYRCPWTVAPARRERATPAAGRPGVPQQQQQQRRAGRVRGQAFKVVVDLLRLSEVQGPERELLRRFLASVQVQRQDFNGEVLTIRSEDLRVMAPCWARA